MPGVAAVSDQPIDGTVRPGAAPADAHRPSVIIRTEDGTVTQVAAELDDGTTVEVTMPEIEAEAFGFMGGVDLLARWRMRYGLGTQCLDPSQLLKITGT